MKGEPELGRRYDGQMKLSEILETDLVAREVRDGYISCSGHPDDPALKVLCYGKVTQIMGHWNEATKQCRGLIVRSARDDFSDAGLVARPWRKFFTLQQAILYTRLMRRDPVALRAAERLLTEHAGQTR